MYCFRTCNTMTASVYLVVHVADGAKAVRRAKVNCAVFEKTSSRSIDSSTSKMVKMFVTLRKKQARAVWHYSFSYLMA